jgi:hypothetical protein
MKDLHFYMIGVGCFAVGLYLYIMKEFVGAGIFMLCLVNCMAATKEK